MAPGKKSLADGVKDRSAPVSALEALESRRLLSSVGDLGVATPSVIFAPSASGARVAGFSPSQIRGAYGLGALTATGAGQTVAIVDAYNDPSIASDLATFDAKFGLPSPPSLKVVGQGGASVAGIASDAGWAGEVSLDVEWAHAIAPGADILLVEARDASLGNLLSAVNYARGVAGVSVVSMSWGSGEFYGQTAYDSDFTTPAGHGGVTFVAASGDQGSQYGVEWPASSPDVLSVGGTTLSTTTTGAYAGEAPWANSTGGYSAVEAEPRYQQAVQNSGARTVPDVAYNADPNSGFSVYDSVKYDGQSGWQVFGGASAGAPQWGAMVAICDQARAADKLPTLDGASQTLPTLYSPYSSPSTYALDYHDVTTHFSWYGREYQGNAGYDLQTGLGTPNGPALMQSLAGSAAAALSAPSAPEVAHVSVARPSVANVTRGNAQPVAVATTADASAFGHTVFNDTNIRFDAVTFDSPAAPLNTSATSSSAPQLAATGGSFTLSKWIGQTSGTGTGRVREGTSFVGAVGQSPLARPSVAARAASAGAKAVAAHTAATLSEMAGAIPAASVPAALAYRFASFDPVQTFSDAMAAFARESASIYTGPAISENAGPSPRRAWIITGAVIAADVLLAAHWARQRAATKRKQRAAARADDEANGNVHNPQAGLTGL